MPVPVIIGSLRTPIGALGDSLAPVRPDDLAAHVLKAILERNRLDPAGVEEVYLGCALKCSSCMEISRKRLASVVLPIPPSPYSKNI